MHLLTPGRGWVLTDRLLVTPDGGAHWSDITPPGVATEHIWSVFFRDPTHGFAAVRNTTTMAQPNVVTIFRTSDGGQNWSSSRLTASAPRGGGYGPSYINFVDDQHGWFVVDLGSHAGFVYAELFRTSDTGGTWVKLSIPESAPVRFINPLEGFSAGIRGKLYVTHDGGDNWQLQPLLPLPDPYRGYAEGFFDLPTFTGRLAGVLPVKIAKLGSTGIDGVSFFVTNDGGNTWVYKATVPNPESRVMMNIPVAVVDMVTWMAHLATPSADAEISGMRRLHVTTDAGSTWQMRPAASLPATSQQLSFASSQVGWAVVSSSHCATFKSNCSTQTALFATSDGAQTWRQVALP